MADRTYYLHSYGCQMNLADSGILSAAMEAAGYQPVAEPSRATVIIINTCSVRERAEERALGRLRELASIKRDRPVTICTIGCMAQRYGQRLLDKVPELDYILGTERLFELPQLLQRNNGCPVVNTDMERGLDWSEYAPIPDNRYCAHVTITRGCNNFCAYCVVPHLRGPERHRTPEAILADVARLAERGVAEVTLVGQNVNSYRHSDLRFPDLVRRVAGETAVERIRFITSHPKDVSDDLLSLFADEPKLMPHLHLPLQSGSDRILELMFRKYDYRHYAQKVQRLREIRDDVAITTDLIVGFPTETEEDYQMTLDAVREIEFDSAFMFRYSVREETWAGKNLEDDVPEEIKLDRLKKLIDLQKDISYRVNQREIGRIRQVLVDGTSRRDDTVWKGKTGKNKTLLFKTEEQVLGKIIPLRVTQADSWTLHGETLK